MQVLGVVIPKLEELQQQGAVGQRKITQYTRYVTIALATLQATGLTFIFGTGNGQAFFGTGTNLPVPLLPEGIWPRGYLIIPTLVAGTALLMWIGELISQRGIGNGMSMVIFASVVSSLPYGYYAILAAEQVGVVRHHRRSPRLASSSPSSSSSSDNDEYPCSSPNGSSGAGCTAARTPTSRSRSTSRA